MGQDPEPRYRVLGEKGLIALGGVFTGDASGELFAAYNASGAGSELILDFSGIEHIDVSGINELIKLIVRAGVRGRSVTAVGLNRDIKDIFKVTRIDEAIRNRSSSAVEPVSVYDRKKIAAWARPVEKITVSEVPEGAISLNVDGLKLMGPLQGFGRFWEKTYHVRLAGVNPPPAVAIAVFKEHFSCFQPPQNNYFTARTGIKPGEVVLINAHTAAGFVCTGLWVIYADDESFALMTPQGHPESGWVSFSAFKEHGSTVVKITSFARASDPLYEIWSWLTDYHESERVLTQVLESLAGHFGAPGWINILRSCIDPRIQLGRVANIRYNARIRTMLSLQKGHAYTS
ncbi:MAG TPA: STAS domain-containing protein [Desulfomonilia bacterium]|nr:STAS domain-containing protein [Desulfomonilia bacterium]